MGRKSFLIDDKGTSNCDGTWPSTQAANVAGDAPAVRFRAAMPVRYSTTNLELQGTKKRWCRPASNLAPLARNGTSSDTHTATNPCHRRR